MMTREPLPRCRTCRQAFDGPEMTCSPECEHERRLRDDMPFEALSLSRLNLARANGDILAACASLYFVYRSDPDAYETAVRDNAIALLLSDATEEEVTIWEIFTNSPFVTSLATALQARDNWRAANRKELAA